MNEIGSRRLSCKTIQAPAGIDMSKQLRTLGKQSLALSILQTMSSTATTLLPRRGSHVCNRNVWQAHYPSIRRYFLIGQWSHGCAMAHLDKIQSVGTYQIEIRLLALLR